MLTTRGFQSRIHRKKPTGRWMPQRMRVAKARKSKVRVAVEHVFAHQKGLMGVFIRTIGLARAKVKIGLANLADNMRRFVWLQGRSAPACGRESARSAATGEIACKKRPMAARSAVPEPWLPPWRTTMRLLEVSNCQAPCERR
jgi:hypothetical protein